MNKRNTSIVDVIGMCTSMLCAIHCLSIPFLLVFGLDTILRVVDQEWVEGLIVGLSLIIGLIAFGGGYLKHRQHYIPVLFVAGFLLLINAELVSEEWISVGLSVAGASVIIYTHVQNLKWKRNAFTS